MSRYPSLFSVLVIGASAILHAEPVRETENLVRQWTDLAHQRDQLDASWRSDRPLLEQQLALLQREERELTSLLDQSREQQDEVEQRRLDLLTEQTRLEQEQAALERVLVQAETQLRGLQGRLPPPLQESWEEQLSQFSDELVNVSEKLQLAIELLGEIDDFQQKITLNESIMQMPDGQEYLVRQVYVGISHGWYVSPDLQFAGAGRAGTDAWQWQEAGPGQAAVIAEMIAMLERRATPELVTLQLELQPAEQGGN